MKCSRRNCRMAALHGQRYCWNHTKDPAIIKKRKRAKVKSGKSRRKGAIPLVRRNGISYGTFLRGLPSKVRQEIAQEKGGVEWFKTYDRPDFYSESKQASYPFPLTPKELAAYNTRQAKQKALQDQLAAERKVKEDAEAKLKADQLEGAKLVAESEKVEFTGKPPRYPHTGQYWRATTTNRWKRWDERLRPLKELLPSLQPEDAEELTRKAGFSVDDYQVSVMGWLESGGPPRIVAVPTTEGIIPIEHHELEPYRPTDEDGRPLHTGLAGID